MISQASLLTALNERAHKEKESVKFDLAVTGEWSGKGQIDFGTPKGLSTERFPDVNSFSFVATSSLGTSEFTVLDLSFACWNVGPAGLMISFSILTKPVDGFSLSMQLGKEGAKLESPKFATLEAGTLTHSCAQPVAKNQHDDLRRRWTDVPFLREVK